MDCQFAFCENSLRSLCLIYILIRNLLLRHKWWPVVVHKLICPNQFVEPYSRVNKQCTGYKRVTATKTTITTATAYICHCQKGWVFIEHLSCLWERCSWFKHALSEPQTRSQTFDNISEMRVWEEMNKDYWTRWTRIKSTDKNIKTEHISKHYK